MLIVQSFVLGVCTLALVVAVCCIVGMIHALSFGQIVALIIPAAIAAYIAVTYILD